MWDASPLQGGDAVRVRARAAEQDDFGAYAMSLVLVVAMAVAWMLATWPAASERAAFERRPLFDPIRSVHFWLLALGHSTLEVEIDATGAQRRFVAAEWPGGWIPPLTAEPGRVVERVLSFAEWDVLVETVRNAAFWDLPFAGAFPQRENLGTILIPSAEDPDPCISGKNGPGVLMWIRVADSTRAHSSGCFGAGPLREIGEQILRMSLLDPDAARLRVRPGWWE
jgi:hypothetical protein